jgi:hypothetical protein
VGDRLGDEVDGARDRSREDGERRLVDRHGPPHAHPRARDDGLGLFGVGVGHPLDGRLERGEVREERPARGVARLDRALGPPCRSFACERSDIASNANRAGADTLEVVTTRVFRGSLLAGIAVIGLLGCSLVAGLGDYTAGTPDAGAPVGDDGGASSDAGDAGTVDGGPSSEAGDAGAGACDASTAGIPVELRRGVIPLHLDVDPAGNVYWTEVGGGTPTVGNIVRASPCSGAGEYEILQYNVPLPPTDVDVTKPTTTVGAIAVDAHYVYWGSGATIQRAVLAPDAGAVTYEGQPAQNTWIEALAIVGTRLCWIEQVLNTAITVWCVDTAASPTASPTPLNPNLADQTSFYALAGSRAGYLFAATEGKVFATSALDTPGTMSQIATTSAAEALGAADSVAFWATAGAFIFALDANSTGGGGQAILENQRGVLGITSAGQTLVWSVGSGVSSSPPGGLTGSSLDGGNPHTFVTGQNAPADVRVGGGNVYWLDRGNAGAGNGSVLRVGLD